MRRARAALVLVFLFLFKAVIGPAIALAGPERDGYIPLCAGDRIVWVLAETGEPASDPPPAEIACPCFAPLLPVAAYDALPQRAEFPATRLAAVTVADTPAQVRAVHLHAPRAPPRFA